MDCSIRKIACIFLPKIEVAKRMFYRDDYLKDFIP